MDLLQCRFNVTSLVNIVLTFNKFIFVECLNQIFFAKEICMKGQILFSEKNKNSIVSLSSAKLA